MKNKLTNNIGYKIASLLIAFGLWLVVINIEDPVSSQSFSSIPVNFTNTSVLTEQGLVYEVQEGTNVVRNITVSGPRSVVEQLTSGDVTATADFNNLTAANTIPIDFTVNRFADKITKVKGSISNVKLTVENEKTIRLVLKVNAIGEVAEGYILGNMTPDQNQIIITGAESVVDQIAKAVAEVDVTDATANIATYADVILLDSEGEPVVSDSISQKVTSVRVSVEVLTTKKLPLSFGTSGTPAEGYAVSSDIESEPSMITVAGTASALNRISRIDVPVDEINITGQKSDMTVSVDIADYLPSGITLAEEDFNGKVLVTVHIEPAATKTVILFEDNVKLSDQLYGYKWELENFSDREVIKLEGLEENLAEIDSDSLIATIDLKEVMEEAGISTLKAGTYEAKLHLDLPEGVQVSGEDAPTVSLVISAE